MRFRSLALVLALFAPAACGGGDGASSGDTGLSVETAATVIGLQNQGIGHLERYDYGKAAAVLEEAYVLAPDWQVAKFHVALAWLHSGAETRPKARQMMEEIVATSPEHVHALFAAGILAENAGEPEAAVPHLRRAWELSGDAAIGAKLGTLLVSLDEEQEAFRVLSDVHDRRPALVSPVNALMLLNRRLGDEETAQTFYDKLIALKGSINDERKWIQVGEEMRDAYGNLGPYSLAIRDFGDPGSAAKRPTVVPLPELIATLGGAAVCGSPPPGAPAYLGLTAFDYDVDGDLDLFVCGGTSPAALLRNDGELRFTDVTAEAGIAIDGAYAVAAGELDVDPKAAADASGGSPVLVDLIVLHQAGTTVLRNGGDGTFADVTEASGFAATPAGSRALLLFDADHDGDLDVFLSGAAGGSNLLYANRGPGAFVDVTEECGLGGDGNGYGPALVVDPDEDLDFDLLVTRPNGAPTLFLNDRLLRFTERAEWIPETADASHGAMAVDLDRDGHEDVVLSGESAATLLRGTGTGFEAQALVGAPGGPAVSVDAGLRGLRDLLFTQGTLLPAAEDGGFSAPLTFGATGVLGNALVADLDGDGSEEIVRSVAGAGIDVLGFTGEGRGNGLTLDFRGVVRNDVQAGWSNLEGRGAWVEVKAGPFWHARRVGGVSGYGVSHPTRSVFGVGEALQADFVRVLWPDAVQQGVLDVPIGAPYLIVEEQRRPDSCPLLFVWDGRRFAWVTDFIGAGGLGFLIAPGVYAEPDPTESVKVPADLVAPDDQGRLAFKFVEAMEEMVYLDHFDLLVVDHPADVSVHPDERFTGVKPFADGRLLGHRAEILPVAARDGKSRDVLRAIADSDRIYSEDPELHPRLTGAISESTLELDFGDRLAAIEPGAPLVLYLDGWIEYGYTRTSVAAAGEGFEYIVPVLDAWDEDAGEWRPAVADLGYPAGFPRVMTYDVTGVVSRETPRLRIRTNLEIYWDRVWLGERVDLEKETRSTVLHPVVADLRRVGYPREFSPDGRHPRIYDYGTLDAAMPWKTVEGDYTKFGDVLPLLAAADVMFVIYGKGEEIDVRFDPSSLPALPDGWTRSYVLRFTGWCKGQELYIAHGFTVEPLPFLGMSTYPYGDDEHYPTDEAHRRYREEWNTRATRRLRPAPR
jgi:tetratricopeptide (TPR) repeat protein